MDSPWSLCAEGTKEPHLDPGCYPAMYDQVVPESIPMQRKSDKRQNNLRNRPRSQDGRLVIFRFAKPAQMLMWLAPRKCKLLCTNKVLTTFDILQHSSTTSLTVSHLHVSPSISPWPTLALILKRPRGSTTTSSRTCEAKQKNWTKN